MGVLGKIERTVMQAPAGAALLHLLDAWLRPGQEWSLRKEYPQVFGSKSKALQHILHDDGTILAHAATLDLPYKGHGREFTIRVVGSVVAHPGHRREGHATTLIEALARDFARDTADLMMLWSDDPAFYGRCGFEPMGVEHILRLSPTCLGPSLGLLRRAEACDVPSMHAMHGAKPNGTRRSPQAFEALLSIPRCETWVLEVADEILAYGSLGRGLDFCNYIHEVGGHDPEVASLISALLMEKGQDLGLLLPPYRDDLCTILRPSLVSEDRTPLGLGIQKSPIPGDFYLEGFDSI